MKGPLCRPPGARFNNAAPFATHLRRWVAVNQRPLNRRWVTVNRRRVAVKCFGRRPTPPRPLRILFCRALARGPRRALGFPKAASSRGSVDTTRTPSNPQRVGLCTGDRPIGAAKGKQTMASCTPPPPPFKALGHGGGGRARSLYATPPSPPPPSPPSPPPPGF